MQVTLELPPMGCGRIYIDYALASDDWDGSDPAIPTGQETSTPLSPAGPDGPPMGMRLTDHKNLYWP